MISNQARNWLVSVLFFISFLLYFSISIHFRLFLLPQCVLKEALERERRNMNGRKRDEVYFSHLCYMPIEIYCYGIDLASVCVYVCTDALFFWFVR